MKTVFPFPETSTMARAFSPDGVTCRDRVHLISSWRPRDAALSQTSCRHESAAPLDQELSRFRTSSFFSRDMGDCSSFPSFFCHTSRFWHHYGVFPNSLATYIPSFDNPLTCRVSSLLFSLSWPTAFSACWHIPDFGLYPEVFCAGTISAVSRIPALAIRQPWHPTPHCSWTLELTRNDLRREVRKHISSL